MVPPSSSPHFLKSRFFPRTNRKPRSSNARFSRRTPPPSATSCRVYHPLSRPPVNKSGFIVRGLGKSRTKRGLRTFHGDNQLKTKPSHEPQKQAAGRVCIENCRISFQTATVCFDIIAEIRGSRRSQGLSCVMCSSEGRASNSFVS